MHGTDSLDITLWTSTHHTLRGRAVPLNINTLTGPGNYVISRLVSTFLLLQMRRLFTVETVMKHHRSHTIAETELWTITVWDPFTPLIELFWSNSVLSYHIWSHDDHRSALCELLAWTDPTSHWLAGSHSTNLPPPQLLRLLSRRWVWFGEYELLLV